MTIDNFDKIKPLFYFNEANNMFFLIQLVRRAKDHKPNKIKETTIQSYFVRSREELDELKSEIVALCQLYGARAYINVAGKDFDALNRHMLSALADANIENPSKQTDVLLLQEAGRLASRVIRWVVDVDTHADDYKNRIYEWLSNSGLTEQDWVEIPTLNGIHIITKKKFNTWDFDMAFPDASIHKNSMGTLLYMSK